MDRNQKIIKEVATEFATAFVEQRRNAIVKKRAVATGELADSFAFEVEEQAQREGIELAIAFAESGRFIDMKPRPHTARGGKETIERLERWVERRGLSAFLPGYLKLHPNAGERKGLNISRMVNHIAWGIATNRTNGKYRQKKVWNKAKTAGINDLINKVAAALPLSTSYEITENLKSSKQ